MYNNLSFSFSYTSISLLPICFSMRIHHSNESLAANIGFDTAENEPYRVCPLSVYRSPASLFFFMWDFIPSFYSSNESRSNRFRGSRKWRVFYTASRCHHPNDIPFVVVHRNLFRLLQLQTIVRAPDVVTKGPSQYEAQSTTYITLLCRSHFGSRLATPRFAAY